MSKWTISKGTGIFPTVVPVPNEVGHAAAILPVWMHDDSELSK